MMQNPFMDMKALFEVQLPYVYDESKIKMKNYVLNNAFISTNMDKTTSMNVKKHKKKDYLHSKKCGVLFVESKRPLKRVRFE